MAETQPLLELHAVSKAYGEFLAVDSADLSLHAGQIIGLVGKNGAGKSSLCKALTGVTPRDSGDILVRGASVDFDGPAAAHRAGVAVVHQELSMVPVMSVAENIRLGAGFPRRFGPLIDWVELRRRTHASLVEVGLQEVDPRSLMSALSPVQQRLVMIAAALVHDIQVLVLDEPTASFADKEVEVLHEVMRRLSARGVGIIFISHRLDEVLELTDSVVVMRDGRVVETAATSAITKSQLVALITGSDVPHKVSTPSRAVLRNEAVLTVTGMSTTANPAAKVSFAVHRGEVLGIAGLVGSGRSELLRAIYGADHRVSGSVAVGGAELHAGSPGASVGAGLALLTEDRRTQGLVEAYSVRQNITLASLPKYRIAKSLPVSSVARESSVSETLVADIGIKTAAVTSLVTSLSGGNQQKVLLARWLASGPNVLLLDEPTVGVDVGAKADIQNLILELAEGGLGVVVVSSEFMQLEQMCHRVLVLSAGDVVAELTGSEITERSLLDACFDAHPDDEVSAI